MKRGCDFRAVVQMVRVRLDGIHQLVCMADSSRMVNPYEVYLKTWEYGKSNWPRKKLAEFADLTSALCFITDYMRLNFPGV